MPMLFIHAINSEYRARDEGADYAGPDEALAAGVRSAAALAFDEIARGKSGTSVEIRVEQPDGTPLLRSVLSMSVSPLMLMDQPTADAPE